MQGKDSEESVMEKPDVCSKETENGDAKQQGGLKKKNQRWAQVSCYSTRKQTRLCYHLEKCELSKR
jgi:hypothetical protein